jgi:hypothetical protein
MIGKNNLPKKAQTTWDPVLPSLIQDEKTLWQKSF